MSDSTFCLIHLTRGMHASITTKAMPHVKPAAMPASTLPGSLQHQTSSSSFGQIFFLMPFDMMKKPLIHTANQMRIG